MKERNHTSLIHKMASVAGVAALASLATLPALAQMSPQRTPTNMSPGVSPGQSQGPSVRPGVPGSMTPANPARGAAGSSSAAVSPLDREFIVMAAQGNNAEIQTSQLALQRSTDANIKQYAQMMVQQHTAANEKLQQLATQQGVTLPADPGPLNTAVAQKLGQLSGRDFDQAYSNAQVNAHLQSVALYQTEVQQGTQPALKGYATQLLPSIQDHLQMANRMTGAYNAQGMQQGIR